MSMLANDSSPAIRYEDMQAHINEWTDCISNASDDVPDYYVKYMRGQVLLSQGKYHDALQHIVVAMNGVRLVKHQYEWEAAYVSIGTMLASLHDYMGNVAEAYEVYNELLLVDETSPYIGDYAVFLHRRRRDFAKAEEYYLKAIQLFPAHSSVHLKYAGFLRHVRQDMSNAENYYKKAIEANPMHADALGTYASYLHGVVGDIEAAQQMYLAALQVDGTHSNNLCNYGLFLSEEKENYDLSEEYYKKSLKYSPKHANALYNYGVMLDTHCNKKDEAVNLYRRCVEVEPRHAYALYNLAVLLEEELTSYEQSLALSKIDASKDKQMIMQLQDVYSLYKRAVDADPSDATALADCGRFIGIKIGDTDSAMAMLRDSLQLDSHNEIALYNLGILLYKTKSNVQGAVELLNSLLVRSPTHSSALQYLARIHVDLYKEQSLIVLLDKAMEYYERAITLQKEAGSTIVEYLKVVSTCGSNRQMQRSVSFMVHASHDKVASGKDAEIRHLLLKLERV